MEVSVVMSVYNEREKEIEESIVSICEQTFKEFEFIIVIDNPNNKEIIDKVNELKKKDKRIKVLINDENIGLASSLNKAIDVAKGKYILRMDADDISLTNRIEKLLNEIKKEKNIILIGSNAEIINESNEIIGSLEVPTEYETIKKMMKIKNCFIHPSVLFRKDYFIKVGRYRNFPCAQDYDLFLRMINNGGVVINLKERLLKYRIRENSISNNKRLLQILIAEYIKKINRKNKKYNFSEKQILEITEEYLLNNEKYKKIRREVKKSKYMKRYMKIIKNIFISKYYRILLKNKFLEILIKCFERV